MVGHDSIIVLGAGGHAKVVISTLRAAGFSIERLLDDDPSRQGVPILGLPVSGPLSDVTKFPGCRAVIAIGDNARRRQVATRFTAVRWAAIVHPTAIIDPTAVIGPGTVVFAGAIIQPDTVIGRHAIINTGATIDHDCRIGDYAHIAPGCHLCGGVTVGESALLGVGSVVIPGKSIGARSVVGAGSVVVHDVLPGIVSAGLPARPIGTVD